MKWKRPSNATIGALVIFIVSFGIWLTQPTPDEPGRTVLIPGVDFEFLTTTTSTTSPVDTTPATTPPVTPTAPPETQPPVETTVTTVAPETTTTVSG